MRRLWALTQATRPGDIAFTLMHQSRSRPPDEYLQKLEKVGYVIADFARRRDMVREGVEAAAAALGGAVADGESLYDEVAALVEWPVPVVGDFDPEFLALPREAIVSTLTGHQRYFPVVDASGDLLPKIYHRGES